MRGRGELVLNPKTTSANNQQTYLTFVTPRKIIEKAWAALKNEEDENISWRLRLRIHPWSLKRFNYSRVYIFEKRARIATLSFVVCRSEWTVVRNVVSVKVCWRHSELPKALETATSKQFFEEMSHWRGRFFGELDELRFDTAPIYHLRPEYSRRE